MALDARSLRYFAEVVGCGSISRAAGTLGISQPALSKCIRDLESQLQVKLLDRSPTGVAPTLFGRTLYLRAKSVTAEISRAHAEVRELAEAGAGLVRLGVLPSQVHLLSSPALRLLKLRPGVRLCIIERSRSELMTGLMRSDFDLIVSVIRPDQPPHTVSSVHLHDDRPSVILRKSHPLSRDAKVRFRALFQFPWILPPLGSDRREDLDRFATLAGLEWPPKTIVECHSHAFLKSMVLQSDCVGLLPSNIPTSEENAGLVRSVLLDEVPSRPVGLLYRSDYPQTDATLAAMREITAAFARRQRK
jgi:LysR family transcriptional regulator of gallate degradation